MKHILDRAERILKRKSVQIVVLSIMGIWACGFCIPQIIRISVSNSTSCYAAYNESRTVYDQITLIVNDETERPVNDEQLTVWRELKRATNDYECPIFPHEHDTKNIKANTDHMRGLINTYKVFREDPKPRVTPEQAQTYQRNQKLTQTCPYDCPARN